MKCPQQTLSFRYAVRLFNPAHLLQFAMRVEEEQVRASEAAVRMSGGQGHGTKNGKYFLFYIMIPSYEREI